MDERTHGPTRGAGDEITLRERVPAFPGDRETKARPRLRLRPFIALGLLAALALGVYRIAGVVYAPKEPGPSQQATAQPVAVATIATGDINVVVTALGT